MLLRSASLALAASLAMAPVAASADTAKPVAAEVVSVKTPAPATQQDSTNYAAREQQDKQATLATLFQLFGVIGQNPTLLQNPTLAKIFNQIVETAGVSPLFMQADQTNAGQMQPQPQPNMQTPPPAPALPQATPAAANGPAL